MFLYYLKNIEKIQSSTADNKYKILFQNLKSSSIDPLLIKVIQILRKLAYGVNLICLHDNAYIQVIINSSFSLCILHYMIYHKPYASKKDLVINIFIEGNIFMILSLIGAYLKDDLWGIIYKLLEIGIIALLYGSILVPASINLLFDIRIIIEKFKTRGTQKAITARQPKLNAIEIVEAINN